MIRASYLRVRLVTISRFICHIVLGATILPLTWIVCRSVYTTNNYHILFLRFLVDVSAATRPHIMMGGQVATDTSHWLRRRIDIVTDLLKEGSTSPTVLRSILLKS